MEPKKPISRTNMNTLSHSFPIRLGIPIFTLLGLFAPVFLNAKSTEGTISGINNDLFQLEIEVEGEDAPRTVSAGPGDIAIAKIGREIRGSLVRQGDSYRLEKIFPNNDISVAKLDTLGRQLISENHRLGRKVFRTVGDRVPRYALWKEDGELFESESLRGQYYVMNFVFTRCTMANMCPASTQRMIELSDEIKERGWEDVKLVSVTLDPAYDTPGIWTSYAESRGIDTSIHSLLGGPKSVVQALKKQMGVLAEEDEKLIIKHTMSTALIDPTGKIIYRLPGSMWSPTVFVRQIERAKEK